jgi:hypothetical protein
LLAKQGRQPNISAFASAEFVANTVRVRAAPREFANGFCILEFAKKLKKRGPMVWHLSLAFWASWHLEEENWQKCQTFLGLANGISAGFSWPRRTPRQMPSLICKVAWSTPIFRLCICIWEFAKKPQMPTPLELL